MVWEGVTRSFIFNHRLATSWPRSWVVAGCLTELWCWDACAQSCSFWPTDQLHSLVLTWLVTVSLPSWSLVCGWPWSPPHHWPFALYSLLGTSRAVPLLVGASPCLSCCISLTRLHVLENILGVYGLEEPGHKWKTTSCRRDTYHVLNNKLHRQLTIVPVPGLYLYSLEQSSCKPLSFGDTVAWAASLCLASSPTEQSYHKAGCYHVVRQIWGIFFSHIGSISNGEVTHFRLWRKVP